MLNTNQFKSLKNIYSLFANICENSNAWLNEINKTDEIDMHKEKLIIIMHIVANITDPIEGELDDIIIIVEEYLKEYILEIYSREKQEESATDSDNEIIKN